MLKQVNVRLEDSFIKEIKRICLEQEISFQDAVKDALEKWVEDQKK